ncbi:DUF72 domain-containing protein [Pseudomonas sp. HR96]|uniref:DUF72 domain-containing protein n=1 Tax=Pseudomonas sp. HR96 TaxID=1027966 RepID=UPI002A754012|nr:DUF72 domain-containing protein [Pseudomonas sp. HR96]WPO98185.1 DUF72 domain-containing protein [Pseudomonas sp. HR96]
MSLLLGCAGWSLPRGCQNLFPVQGSHLQRYSQVLGAVEINSSFYRPHRPATYARWAQSVPAGFRFSVKMPKQITHVARLNDCSTLLDEFLGQCAALGDKLGCLLVQLPPSLHYQAEAAEEFFTALRERYSGAVALEPRHPSWLQAQPLLIEQRIARVAADPAPIAGGDIPGGWNGFEYWRLHGSPRIYYSAYGQAYLQRLVEHLPTDRPVWVIFDNTAGGEAVGDALLLKQLAS